MQAFTVGRAGELSKVRNPFILTMCSALRRNLEGGGVFAEILDYGGNNPRCLRQGKISSSNNKVLRLAPPDPVVGGLSTYCLGGLLD